MPMNCEAMRQGSNLADVAVCSWGATEPKGDYVYQQVLSAKADMSLWHIFRRHAARNPRFPPARRRCEREIESSL